MIVDYELFYRKYGVKKITHLINPNVALYENFTFPKSSNWHFISHKKDIVHIDKNNGLLTKYTKKINIRFISELFEPISGFKKINKAPKAIYREWLIQNSSKFKIFEDEPNDALSLNIYNYNLLKELNVYPNLLLNVYFEWFNLEKTKWKYVSDSAINSKRHQFIFCEIPLILPSVSLLNYYSDKTNNSILKLLNTHERLWILQIWRWLNITTRSESTMNVIDDNALGLINLVVYFKDKMSIINLGLLNSWNSDNSIVSDVKLSPKILSKFFLKYCLTIQESVNEITEEVENNSNDNNSDNNNEDSKEIVTELTPNKPTIKKNKNIDEDDEEISDELVETLLKNIDVKITEKKIDKELKDLDSLNELNYEEEDVTDLEEEPPKIDTTPEEIQGIKDSLYEKISPDDSLKNLVELYASDGVLNSADYRTLKKDLENMNKLKSPYEDALLNDFIKIDASELQINSKNTEMPDSKLILDKNGLKSTLNDFDSRYVNDVIKKDIVANVNLLKKAGFIIKNYEIETEVSAMGTYEHHTVKVKPVRGAESTLHFRIPKVNEEGEFKVAGNKCRMRKQRSDVPIRKISPSIVALTSYYGKVFVSRSDRKQFDDVYWISNLLVQIGLSGGTDIIKKIVISNVFDNSLKVPYIYSGISTRIKEIHTNSYVFTFEYSERTKLGDIKVIESIEKDKYVVCGYTKAKEFIVVDYNDEFHVYRNKEYVNIGNIYTILGLDAEKLPLQFSELRVFSKTIPLGVVLAYYIGITNLIKLLNVKPKILQVNERIALEPGDWILKFKDYKLIFNRRDKEATMIMAGFRFFKDSIKDYIYENFDDKNIYLLILDQRDISGRYLRELETLDSLFIDTITEDILREMNEPVTFKGLLMRSNQLLLTSWAPDPNDMTYMRIKGYERIPGLMYKELINSVREYNSKKIINKSQLSINPYAVWNIITQDQTVKLSEDINPVNDLKEIEALTYVGIEGRAKEAMNDDMREYNINDIGVISESTVDSGDVAINTYLTANPRFKNLRGLTEKYDTSLDKNFVSKLSTSAMLTPNVTNDDPKRANFLAIQNGHTVTCDKYHQPYVKTGYEYVLPYRTNKLWSNVAKEDGQVIELNDKTMIVKYKDGKTEGIKIGTHIGRAEGSFYKHELITSLKLNSKFKKGDILSYNSGFFEPDFLDKSKLCLKFSTTLKTAVLETTQTLEDASSISKKVTFKLATPITKEKVFTVSFKQNINNIIPEGSDVNYNDILFTLEDEITSNTNIFNEKTISTLSRLSNFSPKAKINGKLVRYEVFYNGDIEDMTPSLQKFVISCDKELSKRTKGTDESYKNGRVNEEFRVDGKALTIDTLAIKVYLSYSDIISIGDKVTSIQLKSIISEVYDYDVKTENNEDIEYLFGFRSIEARIVISPIVIGMATTLLKLIGEKATELYDK